MSSKEHVAMTQGTRNDYFDLDQLLHPARAFAHPQQVVADLDLTVNEKRAILASWASDACAVEAAPALRQPPGGPLVTVDEVLEALCALDKEANQEAANLPWAKRQRRRRAIQLFARRRRSGEPDAGSTLSA
jgi:hypothetical protein